MNYKFKTKPYKHQLTALEKSWNKENFAYFMEMGTGKTKVLIDNMSMLYDKGKIDGALIIAPKGVVKTWYEQELPTHLSQHIENVSVLWQPNITKSQQEKLDSILENEMYFLSLLEDRLTTLNGNICTAQSLIKINQRSLLMMKNRGKGRSHRRNSTFNKLRSFLDE